MSGRVCVVGGGFAGFWAAVAARRVDGEAEVTVVSPLEHLVMRPRLYEAAPETLAEPLGPLLAMIDADLVVDSVTAVPADRGAVTLASGGELAYDALVVATGSQMRVPPFAGAAGCHSIDSWSDARRFDRALAVVALDDPPPVVAVIGAGFTGIELALELADRFEAHGRPSEAAAPRVVLIDREPAVGAELGPGPRPAIEEAVAAAGVELRLGAGVEAVESGGVRLAGGDLVAADLVVLCTGMVASPLAGALGAPLDGLGRVVVDPYLRVSGRDRVFAAGDVAAADTGDGHLALQSCQHALRLGPVAGENAARSLLGRELVPYRQPEYVTCLDLGRSGGVFTTGWEREPSLVGAEAGALKRRINTQVIYPDLSGGRDGLLAQSVVGASRR
ncbi:MAG: FAD-dependent oxidoreductase [Acidimicrobiales bacterium]